MVTRVFKKMNILLTGIAIFALGLAAVGRAEKGGEEAEIAQAKNEKQMIQQAKDELNNTTWSIELKQMAVEGRKQEKKEAETDTLRFENYRIESKKLVSEGFAPTNYTVRLKGKENEIVIWETMQTSQEKGLAFWRGEIRDDIMRGVLSWHLDEKQKEDYTFVSVKKEIIPEVTEQEVAPAIQEIEQPEETPAEVKTGQKKQEAEEVKKKEPEASKAAE